MKKYELMLLCKPEIQEAGVKSNVKKITEYLSKEGIKKVDEDYWGQKNLAYKIKNYSDGIYTLLTFEFESSKVPDLKKFLDLNEDLIRYLLTVKE